MTNSARILSVLILIVLIFAFIQAQDTREVQKSGQFSPNGRVHVDTYKGSIRVETWDKSEIDIRATIEPDGTDRRSRDRVQDTEIRIDLSASSARIRTDYEKAKRHHDGFLGLFEFDSDNLPFVHYTIKLPRTTNVVIKDYKSKTTIDNLQSDIEIDTYKGQVAIAKLSGSLTLDTYKGEARVQFANLGGRSRAQTYKGSLEISLPRGKGFDLEADMGRHADLRSDFEEARYRRDDRHRSSDVRSSVNGGGPLLRIKSDKGTVRLREN
jgi:hypothetical protein